MFICFLSRVFYLQLSFNIPARLQHFTTAHLWPKRLFVPLKEKLTWVTVSRGVDDWLIICGVLCNCFLSFFNEQGWALQESQEAWLYILFVEWVWELLSFLIPLPPYIAYIASQELLWVLRKHVLSNQERVILTCADQEMGTFYFWVRHHLIRLSPASSPSVPVLGNFGESSLQAPTRQ